MDCSDCDDCAFKHTCNNAPQYRWNIGYFHIFDVSIYEGDGCIWRYRANTGAPVMMISEKAPIKGLAGALAHVSNEVILPSLEQSKKEFGKDYETIKNAMVKTLTEFFDWLHDQKGDIDLADGEAYECAPDESERSSYWCYAKFTRWNNNLCVFNAFTTNGKELLENVKQ